MKEKITNQSILLFEKKGFSSTSIQDIVDALGVTKGTFYYYFSSKEKLLMDIHLNYIHDLLERQAQIIKEENTTYSEKLHQMVYLLISDIEKQGPSGRVFFREMRHLDEKNAEMIRKDRDVFRQNIKNILKKGIAQGEFRKELQPDMIAFAILGMTNWSYQWYQPTGKISAEDLTKIYVGMILNGIQP